MRSKLPQNNGFIDLHQTWVSWRFLTILTKFDPKSTRGGPKNPNFDPAIKTGWNQSHCEYYWILVPTTIHGSKSELEWPRYHENRDDAPIDALQTSKSHNFWSNRWIFRFHTFLESGSQYLFRIRKPLRPRTLKSLQRPFKGRHLEIHDRGYK